MSILSILYLVPGLAFLAWCVLWGRPGNRRVVGFAFLPIALCYLVAALILFCGQFEKKAQVRLIGIEIELLDREGEPRPATVGGGDSDTVHVEGYPAGALLLEADGEEVILRPGPGYRGDLLVTAGEDDRPLPVAGNFPRLVPLSDGAEIDLSGERVLGPEGQGTLAGRIRFEEEGVAGSRAGLRWSAPPPGPARLLVELGSKDLPVVIHAGGSVTDEIFLRGLPPAAIPITLDGETLRAPGGSIPIEKGRVLGIGEPGSPASGSLSIVQKIPVARTVAKVGGPGGIAPEDVSAEGEETSRAPAAVSGGRLLLGWTPSTETVHRLANRRFGLPMTDAGISILTHENWERKVYPLSAVAGFASPLRSSVVYGAKLAGGGRGAHLLVTEPGVRVVGESLPDGSGEEGREGVRLPQGVPISFRRVHSETTSGAGGKARLATQPTEVVQPLRVRRCHGLSGIVLHRPIDGRSPYVELLAERPQIVAVDIGDARGAGGAAPTGFSINDSMEFSRLKHKVRFGGLSPRFSTASAEVQLAWSGFRVSDDNGRDRPVAYGSRFQIGRDARLSLSIEKLSVPWRTIAQTLGAGCLCLVSCSWMVGRFPFFALLFGVSFLTTSRILFSYAAMVNYPFHTGALPVAVLAAFVLPPALSVVAFVGWRMRPPGLLRLLSLLGGGVRYRWLVAGALGLLLLRCVLAFVFGAKESIVLGSRLSLSLLFVPAHLVLFTAALARLQADRDFHGRYLARPLLRFVAYAAVALLLQTLAGAVVSDLGTFLYLIPPAVLLAAVALGILVEAVQSYTERGSDRELAGVWRAPAIGLCLLVPAVATALVLDQPLTLIRLFPAIHRTITSDEIITERNLLRALQVIDSNALVEMGTDTAEAIAQDHAYVANYAHRGLLGDGFLRVDVVRAKRETALNDNVFAIFALGQFGSLAGIALAVAYLSIALASAPPRALIDPDGDPATRRFCLLLALLPGLTVTLTSFYMMAANYSITPFTGRNLYLLGLNSKSDVLEALVLLSLTAFGISGLLAPVRAWSGARSLS